MTRTRLALVLGTFLTWHEIQGGELTPPAPPNDPASARFTLGDLWNRLATGAAGAKRGASFVEPVTGPTVATTKTTDDIMAAAPAADNVGGATAADVASGKTFWGLRTDGGTWGLQVGTGMMMRYPAPVAKTLQTRCYKYVSGIGTWTDDPGCIANTPPNQDGKLQRGVAWPNPRFTKNGDGTVTDNLTGLVWLGNASCREALGGIQNPDGLLIWPDALTWASALASGHCGLSDGSLAGQWRVPNIRELQSLVSYWGAPPTLPNTVGTSFWTEGDPFTTVQLGSPGYWVSSSWGGSKSWRVDFMIGTTELGWSSELGGVWAVRDAQ